ncbi:MAG TPA: YDG domain-containing protein [bacterium]
MRRYGFRQVYQLVAALVVGVAFAPAPARAVPALDGEGTMSVAPDSVAYGAGAQSFTFTFTANVGDFAAGSQVTLTVPAGWPAPATAGTVGRVTVAPGTCTLSGSPPFAVTGPTILVDIASCLAGQSFTITYSGVTAPKPIGSPFTFAAQSDIGPGGVGLTSLVAGSPSVTVTPATLTVSASGLTPAGKTYDGTTAATLTIGSPTLVGVVGADVVSLDTTGAAGAFADRNVGAAKTVNISGLALTGADAANYVLTQPTRTAGITARPVTVTAVVDSKLYDGTASSAGVAVVSAATPLAAGDTTGSWVQIFDNRNAGTGKSLIPLGTVNDGNAGLNYAYTFTPVAGGAITRLPITVTAVSDTKVYDGTTSSAGVPVLSALTPLAPGDTEPAWTQSFDTNMVGTGKTLTPSGAVNDGNGGHNYAYTFAPDVTGAITPRAVTVEANDVSKGLGMPDPPLSYRVTAGSLATGDALTLARLAGEGVGMYPILVGSFPAAADYNLTFVGGFLTISPTVQFVSSGALDGWVLESSQGSNVGGAVDARAIVVRLGDDAANRQYKAVLSFDTSALPNNAVIQSAVLQLYSGVPVTGRNPFAVLGGLRLDIRQGTFGTKALTATDFQTPASLAGAGVINKTPVLGWYSGRLSAAGRGKINKAGITQLRVYFTKGDNGNRKADFISFNSGNATVNQPQLTITYALP